MKNEKSQRKIFLFVVHCTLLTHFGFIRICQYIEFVQDFSRPKFSLWFENIPILKLTHKHLEMICNYSINLKNLNSIGKNLPTVFVQKIVAKN